MDDTTNKFQPPAPSFANVTTNAYPCSSCSGNDTLSYDNVTAINPWILPKIPLPVIPAFRPKKAKPFFHPSSRSYHPETISGPRNTKELKGSEVSNIFWQSTQKDKFIPLSKMDSINDLPIYEEFRRRRRTPQEDCEPCSASVNLSETDDVVEDRSFIESRVIRSRSRSPLW